MGEKSGQGKSLLAALYHREQYNCPLVVYRQPSTAKEPFAGSQLPAAPGVPVQSARACLLNIRHE